MVKVGTIRLGSPITTNNSVEQVASFVTVMSYSPAGRLVTFSSVKPLLQLIAVKGGKLLRFRLAEPSEPPLQSASLGSIKEKIALSSLASPSQQGTTAISNSLVKVSVQSKSVVTVSTTVGFPMVVKLVFTLGPISLVLPKSQEISVIIPCVKVEVFVKVNGSP